jgi:hypothetical protein
MFGDEPVENHAFRHNAAGCGMADAIQTLGVGRPSVTLLQTEETPLSMNPKPSAWPRIADRFGASASFLCAVHCAVLPLIIAVLPAIGLGILADHRFERGFIVFASVLALTTFWIGFRRHRRFRAFWFLAPGIALLLAGIAVDFEQSATLHAILVSIGGTLVATAHLTNIRLAHGHVHDAACEH